MQTGRSRFLRRTCSSLTCVRLLKSSQKLNSTRDVCKVNRKAPGRVSTWPSWICKNPCQKVMTVGNYMTWCAGTCRLQAHDRIRTHRDQCRRATKELETAEGPQRQPRTCGPTFQGHRGGLSYGVPDRESNEVRCHQETVDMIEDF